MILPMGVFRCVFVFAVGREKERDKDDDESGVGIIELWLLWDDVRFEWEQDSGEEGDRYAVGSNDTARKNVNSETLSCGSGCDQSVPCLDGLKKGEVLLSSEGAGHANSESGVGGQYGGVAAISRYQSLQVMFSRRLPSCRDPLHLEKTAARNEGGMYKRETGRAGGDLRVQRPESVSRPSSSLMASTATVRTGDGKDSIMRLGGRMDQRKKKEEDKKDQGKRSGFKFDEVARA